MATKRSIWAVRDADLAEGSPAKYAASLPRVRPSGDVGLDQENEVVRKDMVHLIDLLMRSPQHIQPTKGWLESRIDRMSTKSDGERFRDVSTLAKLMSDEPFIVAAVMRNSRLTKNDLEKIKNFDNDAVKQLFQVMIEASAGLQLPPQMSSKQVANMVIDRRAAQVGNRLKSVAVSHGVDATGKVLWSEVGPYQVVMDGAVVAKIVHRYSGAEVVLPPEVTITKDFVIDAGHSATKAKAVWGLTKYMLHELFPADAGPNSKLHKPITGRSAVVQRLVSDVEEVLANAARSANEGKEVVDLDDFGVSRKRERNEVNAKKARDALAARAQETTGKRRISLG